MNRKTAAHSQLAGTKPGSETGLKTMADKVDFFAQHAALSRGVGFALLSGRSIIAVTGSDRATFLHGFCTNSVKALMPGQGCEAFITSPQGKTLGHGLIFCELNQLVIDTAPGQAKTLIEHFNRFVLSEDVTFSDRSAELVDLLIAGPDSPTLMTNVCGARPPNGLLEHGAATIVGLEVIVRRVAYAGSECFCLQIASADVSALMNALAESGAVRCDEAAVEAARLEAGFPLFGRDITPDNLPQEIGRDAQAISFTKGCYLGQETIARIDALGHVNQRLVGLRFSNLQVPPSGTAVSFGGKLVGRVTSAAWSPILNAPLALAYLRSGQSKAGISLETEAGAAEVVALPVASS
jgi:folate-binding protein YgfZ